MARRSNTKETRSHIESLFYVQSDVQPGDSLHMSNLEREERYAQHCRNCFGSGKTSTEHYHDTKCDVCGGSGRVKALPITLIDAATGSDYSGNLVEASNARCLKRDFPWVVEIYGGHGTFGVGYLGKRENQNDRLIEAIDSLAEYRVYDEGDHSTLEMEREQEAWSESYGGRHDFKRALVEFFDDDLDEEHEHDLDDEKHDAAIDALWYDCTERLNGGESHLNERGDSIYFPIDSVMRKIGDPQYSRDLDKPHYSGERPSIREQINALCNASRTHDDSNSVEDTSDDETTDDGSDVENTTD